MKEKGNTMEHLCKNEPEDYNMFYEYLFKDIEKNVFHPLPNHNVGNFSISNKKVNNSFFANSLFEESENEVKEIDVIYNYEYETRFSRESGLNLKIDEFTLKRKIMEKKKKHTEKDRIKLNTTREEKPDFINIKNLFLNKNQRERKNLNKNFTKSFFLSNSIEKFEKENDMSMDPVTSYFSNPPYIFTPDHTEEISLYDEPYKVLSAPKLKDDFYLNLLDWSKKNIIAVGLGKILTIWNNNTGKGNDLFCLQPMKMTNTAVPKFKKKKVTSVKWNYYGNLLAVGLSNGAVEVWDTERCIRIRKYKNHMLRVGAICWNNDIVTSGSKDNKIVNCDIRCRERSFLELSHHVSEVCGLEWNYNGKYLASGSNDQTVYIYEKGQDKYLFHLTQHKAAVKALAWSPHKSNLLTTGGGSVDKTICFWNINNGKCIDQIVTSSQVCSLVWSKNTQELISTANTSCNPIVIWKYPELKKKCALLGHSMRVLYVALGPDGSSIASGSADETIRFWKVFPKCNNKPVLAPFYNLNEMFR